MQKSGVGIKGFQDQPNERKRMKIVGLYRIKTPRGQPDFVWVKDPVLEFELPEDRYIAGKYRPEISNLKWKEQAED